MKCELFEYEDEVLDTSISEIDTQLEEEGFITTLSLIGIGRTAEASASLNVANGYVRRIFLNNDGSGYTSTPVITFSSSPQSGGTATAVAITTSIAGVRSVKEILLTNAGFGYTVAPKIYITGGGGTGAAATCSIEPTGNGVVSISIDDAGSGYPTAPTITVAGPVGGGTTATAVSTITSSNIVSSIRIVDPGFGYGSIPSVTVASPPLISGIGTYLFNEEVVGSVSGSRARVKSWDDDTNELKVSMVSGSFVNGETLIGVGSSATYAVSFYDGRDIYDKYSQNDEIESEADLIVDFSQSNPFGSY